MPAIESTANRSHRIHDQADHMPRANAFNGGASCTAAIPCDGLNTAIHRWVQRTIGGDGSTGASADVFKREQYHIKIDHHFNQNHTLSGSFDKEYRYSDNNALTPWPNVERRDDPGSERHDHATDLHVYANRSE
jgi:hypothetical protein